MTVVNPQITDAVTQTKLIDNPPSGNLYQATAQALANAAHNAVSAQQQSLITMQAATVQAVATLLSIDTAALGKQLEGDSSSQPAALGAALAHATASITPPANAMVVPSDIAYGERVLLEAVAASLDALARSMWKTSMHTLQITATSACLTAMIAQPDKAGSYEEVLDVIRTLA